MEKIGKKIKQIGQELLFPNRCLVCGASGQRLCLDCLAAIDLPKEPLKNIPPLSRIYFASYYNQPIIRALIEKYKYQPFAKKIAQDLAFLIIVYFHNLEKKPKFLTEKVVFVPIPLHPSKLKSRGFNQSTLVARLLGGYYGLRVEEQILLRQKKTLSQTYLEKSQRQLNLKNAFYCQEKEKIKGETIVLFDDVLTTGATIKEAAKTLLQAGAKEVIGLVAAKA